MKLLKFEKENCPSCERVDAYLAQYNHIEVSRVNPFEEPRLAVWYGIAGVPVTILLNDNGQEERRSIGFNPQELDEMISRC